MITAKNKPNKAQIRFPLSNVITTTPNMMKVIITAAISMILFNKFPIRLKIKRATDKIASRPMIRLILLYTTP